MNKHRICIRCVMDTTDPKITFDENGICNHCRKADEILKSKPYSLMPEEKSKYLDWMIQKIKDSGKNNKYDCIIGVSGGVDSTFLAYKVKQLGLRPLAVHLDNGWNSELSVSNIEKVLNKLNIDLFTYVINWEEFKDLQIAFLKASTPDTEIITDHAIVSLLDAVCIKNKIKYIILGTNFATESILPVSWSHGHNDWKYIKNIQERFGKMKLKSFPHRSAIKYFYTRVIRKVAVFSILDYIDYNKENAISILKDELDWRPYGNKHYESIFTRFFQGYILPNKFGYDKRKGHLSSLIVSNQITRDEALEELLKPIYDGKMFKEDYEFCLSKFNISTDEFEKIMTKPVKSFWEYPSYENSWYYRIGYKLVKKFIK